MTWELTRKPPLTAAEERARRIEAESKGPTPAQLAAAESQRLSRREGIRRREGKARLADQRRVELAEAIAALDDRTEELAAAHVSQCAPLQAELSSIEKAQADLLRQGQPTDELAEARRKELLAQVETLTLDFEDSLAREQRTRARLEDERIQAAREASDLAAIPSELYRSGRAELVALHRAAATALEWAEARMRAANDKNDRFRSDTSAAELQAASQAVTRAKEEGAAALAAVLDE